MSNEGAESVRVDAHIVEQESKKASQLAEQAEQLADNTANKAGQAITDAEKVFDSKRSTQEEDKSSIQKADFALREAKEALDFGEQARRKAEDARNLAEKARNVAEEARNTAENARDHSAKEQFNAELAVQEAKAAKEKADLAYMQVEAARQKTEEVLQDVDRLRKMAEMAERRYRLVIEGSNDGLWDWNIDTDEIYWNGRFFQMLGITDRNIRSTNGLLDRVHPEDRTSLKEAIESALRNSNHFQGTFRIRDAQDVYLHCLFRGKTLFDEYNGRPLRMAGMITNITFQIEYEHLIKVRENEALEAKAEADALKEQADLANKRKTQALSYMAHEIRTPLNAINGYAEMLIKGMVGELTEKQARCANNIYKSGQHLVELVNDILDIARIEAGKIQLATEWVLVELLVEEVKPLVEESAKQKNVQLHFDLNPKIDGINTDPKRFRQILVNLINNAIKYNREGGQVNVRLYKTEDKQWLVCNVEDNGIGIPTDKLPRLFDEFYRIEQRKTVEGAGIGLSLTKRLIEVQGGTISVESEENVGSTFTFKLPM